MDSHLTTLNRSRSSQTPSPSHSASASATSSLHKSKLAAAATEDHAPPSSFPPSSFSADTRDGALTSSDDLESISARGADSDSDADDLEDDFDHDNNSSIRTFTTARLESEGGGAGSVRNMKLKTENSTVKIENTYGGKDEGAPGSGSAGPPGATAAVGSTMAGISTKEDVKIFTENIQTSGAYSAREESLKREEEAGRLKFVRYSNDGVDQHMVWYLILFTTSVREAISL